MGGCSGSGSGGGGGGGSRVSCRVVRGGCWRGEIEIVNHWNG